MPLEPSDLLLGQITAEEIKEYTPSLLSERTDSFSVKTADLTMKFQVPGDKLKPFLQFTLGVNYMDTSNVLRRALPMFHPVHCWAWASQVQVVGFGKEDDDTAAVIWENQVTPAKWQKYDCTVTFDMPPYNVLPDDSVTAEWQRFVSKQFMPRTELVSIDNGKMLYEANAGNTFNNKPHVGATPVTRRDVCGIKLVWHAVPWEYLAVDDDAIPQKLIQAVGKLNTSAFFGCTAETLLVEEIRTNKYVCPVVTDTIGELYFLCDVEMDLAWTSQGTDAGMANNDDIGKTGETRRGWNMFLGPNTQYWGIRDTTHPSGARRPFATISFAKIFTYRTDTY